MGAFIYIFLQFCSQKAKKGAKVTPSPVYVEMLFAESKLAEILFFMKLNNLQTFVCSAIIFIIFLVSLGPV